MISAMYCSDACLEADKKEFHRFVCGVNAPHDQFSNYILLRMLFKMLSLFDGDVTKLSEFLEANREDLTIFDFDFRNPDDLTNQRNLMLATLSRKNSKEQWSTSFIPMYNNCQKLIQFHPELQAMWNSPENQTFLNRILRRLHFTVSESKRVYATSKYNLNINPERACDIEIDNSAVTLQNAFPGIQNQTKFQNHVMTAVDPFNNLLNHSCVQNVVRTMNEPKFNKKFKNFFSFMQLTQNVGEKSAIVVVFPIRKGEQIFSNYEGSMLVSSKNIRQKLLLDLYGFKCDCIGCARNYPTHEDFVAKEINQRCVILTSRSALAKRKEAGTFYMRCDLIKQNFHLFPCKTLYYFIAECIILLSRLAQPAHWFGGQ